MPRKPGLAVPLPDCEGPKLGPFKHRYAAIEFRRLLSDGDPEADGHAHVFEVSIKSNVYALKVFKFWDDEEARGSLSPEDKELVPINLLHAHMDPFYNECRAYGRLIDANENGKIAIQCYGYMTLPPAIEDKLEERFHIAIWDRPSDEYEKPVSKRQPFRAIVKDLIKEDVEFIKKDVRRMLRDLKQIRSLGVYPMDIRSRNYRAGLLVDFSIAKTEPHYLFTTRPDWQVFREKQTDLILFDRMVKDADIKTQVRALPDLKTRKSLRRRPGKPDSADR